MFLFNHNDGVLHSIITIHVDNLQYCDSKDFNREVIQPMFA